MSKLACLFLQQPLLRTYLKQLSASNPLELTGIRSLGLEHDLAPMLIPMPTSEGANAALVVIRRCLSSPVATNLVIRLVTTFKGGRLISLLMAFTNCNFVALPLVWRTRYVSDRRRRVL